MTERVLSKLDEQILQTLAELGGQQFQEEAITREGTRLVIPVGMETKTAVKLLMAHEQAETEVYDIQRTFKYRPWDGAAAFQRAVKDLTGTAAVGQGNKFSNAELRTIQVDVNETIQVGWGALSVPLFEGSMTLDGIRDPELGPLFHVTASVPKKYKAQVEGFFKLVEKELRERSIYRGKAFDGKEMPDFLDLSGVDPTRVIYSDDVTVGLEANIWSLFRHTEAMRRNNLPLKRSVLLHGPYGTGKTLAAYRTAQVAVENGWTFIYCRPGKDDLKEVMQTARLYQPAAIFFEDVDVIANAEDEDKDGVTSLLDLFDGIQAKGAELVAVMTTNYPERIHKGMVRPGRLDAVLEIGALDHSGVRRMIEAVVPKENVAGTLDYEAIGNSMEGFMPAFVKEAIDRTVRYRIARNGGQADGLVTEDFVHAANGLRPQLDMMNEAKEHGSHEPLSQQLKTLVKVAVSEWDNEN